jgi:hypothetical protein
MALTFLTKFTEESENMTSEGADGTNHSEM